MKKSTLIKSLLLTLSFSSYAVLAKAETQMSMNFGAILFSDFSVPSDRNYVGASKSLPVSLSFRNGDFRGSISTAYLLQDQSDGTTDSDFGDTNVSLAYNLNDKITLGVKHKFATGNQTLGFSSGEDDTSVSFDYFDLLNAKTSYFYGASYKFVGKGNQTDRQNSVSALVGVSRVMSKTFNLAVTLDYTQSSYTTSSDLVSATVFGSHKMDEQWSLSWLLGYDDTQTYLLGTSVSYKF